MSFFEVVRMIIFFIVLMIAWFAGRILVLPNIRVGIPALPPASVWNTIYTAILEICKAVFHYILIFLLIMWIIYWIIKKFVPDFPIPFKTILLALTPLYELRVAGIFNLFDRIYAAIFSFMPIPNRILSVFSALASFLASSMGAFTAQVRKTTGVGKAKPNNKPTAEDEYDVTGENDNSDEPTDDNAITPNENKYIDKEYQQCIAENYIDVGKDATTMEKLSARVKNTQSKTLCSLKKLEAQSNLAAVKVEIAMNNIK
jgi:hypothetical protein